MKTIIFCYIIILSLGFIFSSSDNEYHEHRSRKVDDAIKRYSRAANLEIDEIREKLFERKYATENSLKVLSESTNLK